MKYRVILLTLLTGCLFSCSKQEIPVFTSDDHGVYFQYMSSYLYGSTIEYYSDSLTYSFTSASADATSRVLSVLVRTMGKVTDYDRPIKVVIDEENTTAIEGVHYEENLDTLYIPAGESSVYARIKFLRAEDLLEKTVRLGLKLEANEYFGLYIDEYKNTNSYTTTGEMLDGTRFAFVVSETYTEPSYWGWFGDDYFGAWTAKKYVTLNSVMEWTVSDWNRAGGSGAKVVLGRFSFAATRLQEYLQEQADAGVPVTEADGTYMQLPEPYQVDYSKYE